MGREGGGGGRRDLRVGWDQEPAFKDGGEGAGHRAWLWPEVVSVHLKHWQAALRCKFGG